VPTSEKQPRFAGARHASGTGQLSSMSCVADSMLPIGRLSSRIIAVGGFVEAILSVFDLRTFLARKQGAVLFSRQAIRKPVALFGAVVLSICQFVGALRRLRHLAIR